MAIRELYAGRQRKRIGVFGEQPTEMERTHFSERGYELLECSSGDLSNSIYLGSADSIIFSQRPDKPLAIAWELASYAKLLLNFDCRVYVRVSGSDALREKAREIVVNALRQNVLPPAQLNATERAEGNARTRERDGIALAPFVYVCDSQMTWRDIAQVIADNPAGRAPKLDLDIRVAAADGSAASLTPERALLIQRAFPDCAVVHLHQMHDGLSGVPVFRAYAELATGLLGRWPYLYFVKIGDRKKISDEYANYQGNAQPYIPFHLGPRLALDRCGLGAEEGILVGDFVESAESLRDCAQAGRAGPAIANLFDVTLRPWHEVSWTEESASISATYLSQFPNSVPESRFELAKTLGAVHHPKQLRRYFAQIVSSPVIVGPVHGDLHATNVLVRGTDAILIDFEKASFPGPVLYDFASLEGGLLVEGSRQDLRLPATWLASISCLYDLGGLRDGVDQCHPTDLSTWYFDAVRQIRLYARQFECVDGQYALVLAYSLLRKATNPHTFDIRRESLRAGAYVLAERILVALANGQANSTR